MFYAWSPSSDAFDNDILEKALLRRSELTDEKIRSCRHEPVETKFAVRLSSYFERWIEVTKAHRTY